ncbi:MAG: polysaccharide deacetylase family protein, partial [Bacteroidota bacterium]
MNKLIAIILLSISFQAIGQPTISFTFDDGVTADYPGYPFEVWNSMLLDKLDSARVNAIFFVTGHNKADQKGKFLLESWNDRGHSIANHTYSHP